MAFFGGFSALAAFGVFSDFAGFGGLATLSFLRAGSPSSLRTRSCNRSTKVSRRPPPLISFSRRESAAAIFGPLSAANVNVDMIVQSHARTQNTANMEFTVGKRDAARAVEIVRAAQKEIGFDDVAVNEDVSKVSVIGVGMRSHTGVAKTMFSALAEKGVNIQVISTSEIKISVLIDAAYTELAVRALHAAYGLDQL